MWPFSRPPERRQGFYDAVVEALETAAAGTGQAARPSTTAAAEAAAGLMGRALAMATITPATPATSAVTPDVLASAGRELIKRGEAVFTLAFRDGALRLLPASNWNVFGQGADWRTWSYDVTHVGPSGSRVTHHGAGDVLHFRWSSDPGEPWRGRSPLAGAALTSGLLAATESALADEAGGPRGSLLPVPQDPEGDDDDDSAGSTARLRATIGGLRGKAAIVETTAAGWGEGRDAAPAGDWQPRRLGAAPPAPLVSLCDGAGRAVLAACGVPVELVAGGEGTSLREAWRRFLHSTVQPIADTLAVELAAKLDTPSLALGFDRLFASDVMAKARAWRSMVGPEAAMDGATAARLAGLMDTE